MNQQTRVELPDHVKDRQDLLSDFTWFKQVLAARMALYFGQECDVTTPYEIAPPDLGEMDGTYAELVKDWQLTPELRLILMLALAPEIESEALDPFFIKNAVYDRGHSEFGGIVSERHGGFLPTVESALFLLAGADTALKLALLPCLQRGSFLVDNWILDIGRTEAFSEGKPAHTMGTYGNNLLRLSDTMLSHVRDGGRIFSPIPNNIPAIVVETSLCWDDLIISEHTDNALNTIFAWLEHREKLAAFDGIGKHLKPGYTSLFHGPPGTGKTLTAGLIGKRVSQMVVAVDLSQLVSKYIGETEKNIERLFVEAERRGWILFFDEADAVFGKRTQVTSSNDRHANTETAFLLQRLESFQGLVILASNLPANFDDAYMRRFQSVVHFPMPDASMRQRLYQNCLGKSAGVGSNDIKALAKQYEVTGSTIVNAVRYAWLMALSADKSSPSKQDIEEGLRLELAKEGKSR